MATLLSGQAFLVKAIEQWERSDSIPEPEQLSYSLRLKEML